MVRSRREDDDEKYDDRKAGLSSLLSITAATLLFPVPLTGPLLRSSYLPSPSPRLAAEPDPDLDTNFVPLAWETPAVACIVASPSFYPSNATMEMLSSRVVGAF